MHITAIDNCITAMEDPGVLYRDRESGRSQSLGYSDCSMTISAPLGVAAAD